jgi:hypothetical protein
MFPFLKHSRFTVDTVCTIALAEYLLNGADFATTLYEFCCGILMPVTGGCL